MGAAAGLGEGRPAAVLLADRADEDHDAAPARPRPRRVPRPAREIEGLHGDHVLVVLDESKTIPPAIFDSIEGSFSGAGEAPTSRRTPWRSPPRATRPAGSTTSTREAGPRGLATRHVTLAEAVAAGRITRQWADQRKKLWGENCALYQNHVLGDFHAGDEDSVIPLRWVEAAYARRAEWEAAGKPDPDGIAVIGVDVASHGEDKTVCAVRRGDIVTRLVSRRKRTRWRPGPGQGHDRRRAGGDRVRRRDRHRRGGARPAEGAEAARRPVPRRAQDAAPGRDEPIQVHQSQGRGMVVAQGEPGAADVPDRAPA